eukprot:8596803-Alexandrium_andersonii.AAC.1
MRALASPLVLLARRRLMAIARRVAPDGRRRRRDQRGGSPPAVPWGSNARLRPASVLGVAPVRGRGP